MPGILSHRAFARQLDQMRGQAARRCRDQPGIKRRTINRGHQSLSTHAPGAVEFFQNPRLSLPPMRGQRSDKGRRVGEWWPMARQIKLIIARLKLSEGTHIGRHIAIWRADHAGGPGHDMIRAEQRA